MMRKRRWAVLGFVPVVLLLMAASCGAKPPAPHGELNSTWVADVRAALEGTSTEPTLQRLKLGDETGLTTLVDLKL